MNYAVLGPGGKHLWNISHINMKTNSKTAVVASNISYKFLITHGTEWPIFRVRTILVLGYWVLGNIGHIGSYRYWPNIFCG